MSSENRGPVQCLILAGGLGTRMRPATDALPKTLLPINGRPFAGYQLDWLARCGIEEVIYCIGYKGSMIREYVGDGSSWGIRVRYSEDGPEPRGTAGAIRACLDSAVLEPTFLVTWGDSYLPVDFRKILAFFNSQACPAMMTVYRNENRFESSNACFEDGKIISYNKGLEERPASMRYIDYGILAFRRDFVAARIPIGGNQDLADWMRRWSHEGELAGFEVSERFHEIGSPSGLEELRERFQVL